MGVSLTLTLKRAKPESEDDQETLLVTFWEGDTRASGPTLRKRRERALRRLRDILSLLYGLD